MYLAQYHYRDHTYPTTNKQVSNEKGALQKMPKDFSKQITQLSCEPWLRSKSIHKAF